MLKLFKNFPLKKPLLLAALFLTEFSRIAVFFVFLPLYIENQMAALYNVAGFAAGLHYLTDTAFKWIAGWSFYRLGKFIPPAGLCLSLLSLLLAALWPNSVTILFSAFFSGVGVSPLWPAIITELAPVEKADRSSQMGMIFTAWLAGAGCGLVGTSFLLTLGYLETLMVIISATVAALICSAAVTLMPTAHKVNRPSSIANIIKQVTGNPATTRILLPGMFLQTLSAGLLAIVLPTFASNKLGLGHGGYGMLVLAAGFFTILFLVPMGWLTSKLSLKIMLCGGFLCCGICLYTLALAGSSKTAFPLAALLGISYSSLLPAWNTLLSTAIPQEGQAAGWGIFSTMEGLGIALGPVLGGFVAQKYDAAPVLIMTSTIFTILSFIYLVYPLHKLKPGGV